MKRVLLVSQYFYPENFKGNDIAFDLQKRGYKVDVLTNIPNYPEGVYAKGYGLFHRRVETINGIKVYRAFQVPRGRKGSVLMLALNYISSMLASLFWVLLFFVFKKKYDVILIQQLSPITSAVPGILLGRIKGSKVVTWVLDIWPDSMITTAGEKMSRLLLPIINPIVNYVYNNSSKILISSKGMKALVCRNKDYSNKIIHFPNWCDDIQKMPVVEIPELPNGFVIMMAGSINEGIGPDCIIGLVDELKDCKDVHFVFVGGGISVEPMKKKITEKGLRNVHILGAFPFKAMPAFHCKADAMLLSLRATDLPHLAATVPGRLQTYMAAGKPVLAMINGSAADLIKESNCGYVVDSGNYKEMAEIIRNRVIVNKEDFAQKGINGRRYYDTHFTKEMCMDNLESIINM